MDEPMFSIKDTKIHMDVKPKYNEHLANAVESLSRAVVANAEAIKVIAQMAEHGVPRNVYGVYMTAADRE